MLITRHLINRGLHQGVMHVLHQPLSQWGWLLSAELVCKEVQKPHVVLRGSVKLTGRQLVQVHPWRRRLTSHAYEDWVVYMQSGQLPRRHNCLH